MTIITLINPKKIGVTNMNINAAENHAIAYDENIITKIKEMIESGLNKLKFLVKSENKIKFKIYYEIDKKFNSIAKKLEKYDFLSNEFKYFISISSKIKYIIYKNCKNDSFGHFDYALELFELYDEILDAKIELIHNSNFEKYEKMQVNFRNVYWEYEREFYLNIHVSNGDFTQEEIYRIHENLRE